MRERDRNKKGRATSTQGWAAGKKRKTKREKTERERQKEREEMNAKRKREGREGRAVNGLDIVSVESSSIKSNYDVIDRGPVGRGRGDAEGEAKSSE